MCAAAHSALFILFKSKFYLELAFLACDALAVNLCGHSVACLGSVLEVLNVLCGEYLLAVKLGYDIVLLEVGVCNIAVGRYL